MFGEKHRKPRRGREKFDKFVVLRNYICVRFLKIFVQLAKRQENSEFWCAEGCAEVSKRDFGGKYASFEALSVSC